MFGKTISYDFHSVAPAHRHDAAGLVAGHAVRDITPPPGMPKAGYSSNAHIGKGFRTRLKARVFYLRSQGRPLAFVSLDLLGGSLIVRLRVLALIAAHTDIGPEHLVLGATHTHAGPGQFAACNFYNRFASNRSGFDPGYFEFLCRQISDALIEAYQAARPARVAHGSAEVWGLTRNRSLIPHHKNRKALVTAPLNHAKFYAINPRLALLRIDAVAADGAYHPLGAISTFSIHGTGVSQHEDEYNGDVWAYIERELENGVSAPWPVLHAAVEGTHGDIAPAIHYDAAGYLEARRVGRAIGQQALALFTSLADRLRDDVRVDSALRVLDTFDPQYALPRPVVGAALLAGAQENQTPVIRHLPPFRAGRGLNRTARADDPLGGKHPLLPGVLRNLVLPEDEFPRLLPVQVARIGGFVFAGLPVEITAQAGRRIERQLRAAVNDPDALVTVSSVCNDYFGYCTTADEYGCQYYEGGHTLYGAGSNDFLAAQVARLYAELDQRGGFHDQPERWNFRFQRGDYLPAPAMASGTRRLWTEPVYVDARGLDEGYWALQWCDVNPGRIDWHAPLVSVQYRDGEADAWRELASDEGYDVGVRLVRTQKDGMALYETRWYNPEFRGRRCYRFVIAARNGGAALASAAFGGNILAADALAGG